MKQRRLSSATDADVVARHMSGSGKKEIYPANTLSINAFFDVYYSSWFRRENEVLLTALPVFVVFVVCAMYMDSSLSDRVLVTCRFLVDAPQNALISRILIACRGLPRLALSDI